MFCPACRADYPDDWKACPKDATLLLKSSRIGKYAIEGMLGVGGMGAVYRAINPDTKGRVAVKVMNPAVAGAEQMRTRFQREAAAVAALRTSHVVKVYDFGAEADGTLYLVMELLDGHPLRDEIAPPPNTMDLARVQMVLDGALKGLAAAHRAGIVHRDLKPENIYVADTDDGEVPKLLDFGIARVRSRDSDLTRTGSLMGTASYMAPEQIASSIGEIGPWTDVYAMGAILYEILSGTAAFGGDTVTDILQRVLRGELVPLQNVRRGLTDATYAFVARCMSAVPAERPQDAEQMRAALAQVRLVPPGTPVPPRPTKPAKQPDLEFHGSIPLPPSEGPSTPQPIELARTGIATDAGAVPSSPAISHAPHAYVETQPTSPPQASRSMQSPSMQPSMQPPLQPPHPTSAGQLEEPPTRTRSKLPLVIGGLAIAGIGGAIAFAIASGGDKPSASGAGTRLIDAMQVAVSDAGPPAPSDANIIDELFDDGGTLATIDGGAADPYAGMVKFGPGTYVVGGSKGKLRGTLPKTTVVLDELWIDRDEMTVGELKAALGGKLPPEIASKLERDAASLPARFVDHPTAEAACRALGKRLPSEVEWEIAALTTPQDPKRARLNRTDSDADLVAAVDDCSKDGVCNMLGGLLEWTADAMPNAPIGKVVRGASYRTKPDDVLATIHARIGVAPSSSTAQVGFRCANGPGVKTMQVAGAPPKPVPKPPKPPPPKPPTPPPDPPDDDAATAKCDLPAMRERAKQRVLQGVPGLALKITTRMIDKCGDSHPDTIAIALVAACGANRPEPAKRFYAMLSPARAAQARVICGKYGIDL